MTNTDQRSAQGIAQMAKMRAAAEAAAAAANPPLDEVLNGALCERKRH